MMSNCPAKLLEINARNVSPLVRPRLDELVPLPPPHEISHDATMKTRKIPTAARFKLGDSTPKLQSDEKLKGAIIAEHSLFHRRATGYNPLRPCLFRHPYCIL